MSFEEAARTAITITKERRLPEVGPNELLLGLLLEASRFGIAVIGPYQIDLEELGFDWLQTGAPSAGAPKVVYSDAVVALFDRAALIARVDGCGAAVRLEHALAAFASETSGLMARLKRDHQITAASWRAAAAQLRSPEPTEPPVTDYLTPEQAAETLNIHVQTVRTYVRTGKLPALRIAGERAIRIRRSDLAAVLEPLTPND